MTSWLSEPLRTEHLILRATERGDEEWIRRSFTNPEVRRYLGGPLTEAQALATVQIFGEWWGHFSVLDHAHNRGIGCVSFERKGASWDISYHLQPEFWKRGLATEAVKAAIQWFFDHSIEVEVHAVTQVANTPSCRLLERLGAQITNEFVGQEDDKSASIRQYMIARPLAWHGSEADARMDFKVLFIAGFGSVTRDDKGPRTLYQSVLGIPFEERNGYLHTENLEGAKCFALWPLSQAAQSCFGTNSWPTSIPEPQAWVEFDVDDVERATAKLLSEGYHMLVVNKKEPWGQTVSRFLGPDGLLIGVTNTPWMRK